MNVLIILGHPRNDSLCGALARAYRDGAIEAGAVVREIALADLDFDPDVHTVSPRDQRQEPDIHRAQEDIAWADHLVFVYPTWWGTMPALLKGFLDRVFTPGFAFHEREGGGYEPLLTGKTAHLLTTMDTPPWVYRWIYGAPGQNALAKATLGFCGISPTRVHTFGPVKGSAVEQRDRWVAGAYEAGLILRHGVLTSGERFGRRLAIWLTALRLQFYPMAWVAYTVGALAADPVGLFTRPVYWLGYLCLFLIEAATVLTNEYFDYPTDRQNRYYSPFNGGSRVLTTGKLGFGEVRRGIAVALLLTALSITLLLTRLPASGIAGLLLTLELALGLGYTTPPLKLVYRGWGELTVGITHGLLTTLCGYVLLGGTWYHPLPWLLGIPLVLSILPSIILAGVPDAEADKAVGKNTLAVRLGTRRALSLAMALTILSALAGLAAQESGPGPDIGRGLAFFIVPHALLLLALLQRRRKHPAPSGRIDSLMVASLTYHTWFGLIPLVNQLLASAR